jgi:hypothetical protein
MAVRSGALICYDTTLWCVCCLLQRRLTRWREMGKPYGRSLLRREDGGETLGVFSGQFSSVLWDFKLFVWVARFCCFIFPLISSHGPLKRREYTIRSIWVFNTHHHHANNTSSMLEMIKEFDWWLALKSITVRFFLTVIKKKSGITWYQNRPISQINYAYLWYLSRKKCLYKHFSKNAS